MKITKVLATGLKGQTPLGGWEEELRDEDVVHTLVAVHTDEGLVGIGSVFTTESLVKASLELLSPLLIGENPLEPERVSERLHRCTFWMGRGGSVTHTISGIDTALWDLLGKSTSQPIGRLMGGRYRDRVRPYASLLMEEPGRLADRLSALKEQGWTAFKIGWGPFGRVSDRLDEDIVHAAREAIGDDAMLMVDAGGSDSNWRNDLKWALRTTRMLANYNVSWFEEPLSPDALSDYVELRRAAPVHISGGEVFTRRQSFRPWIEAGAFDIVQPDVTKVGGLSEQRRIGWMAQDRGIRLIPHGWNTAVGLAADLQLASALADTDLVEYIAGSAYVDDICTKSWTLDSDGMLEIPSGPGLGIELDPDALGRYADANALLAR
ncbi:D-galactarolactone cycloisomerase [Rhodococcus sp. LBL1]|uniref:D-galactarolactone cycloisomerase n=1 Tax=Prescottella agglutinans TaxID=1644129 RepID=A0ABT6MI56_9NOCA|nr:mandelate racemase/muconate lactonizing enzyme family protein [Prescottella agglutinans]MDH6283915.1 D-galactarolactone cycloisomerase [Prescottella agglutinans]MDH6677314.1 D-galactarolactone cycloisomerase [Rhodococcus sp. LBL1]MDH6682392.1 D-galactarolactone cycloisomerase [Rhodococcus sp. LBL2]